VGAGAAASALRGRVLPVMRLLVLIPLLALAACKPADNEPGPGGVTVGEARALDEAAEMIEGQTPPAVPEDTGTAAP